MKKEQQLTVGLLAVYLLVLTWIILLKLQFSFADLDRVCRINLIPLAGSRFPDGRINWSEIWCNLLVFLPMGVYVALLQPKRPVLAALGAAFGVSLSYEVLQFILAIGISDVTDLLSNTLGGGLGSLFPLLCRPLLGQRTQWLLNRIALVGTLAVLVFLILLLRANQT